MAIECCLELAALLQRLIELRELSIYHINLNDGLEEVIDINARIVNQLTWK